MRCCGILGLRRMILSRAARTKAALVECWPEHSALLHALSVAISTIGCLTQCFATENVPTMSVKITTTRNLLNRNIT